MSSFWTLKTAWRLGRGRRRRLLLYLSSMVLGVAALVALQGFGTNLTREVGEEAKALLGADLEVERGRPFSDSTQTLLQHALIDSLGGERARRRSFPSMASFPSADNDSGGTRLASVRAVEPAYPFYGRLRTDPPGAARAFREAGGALVDGALLRQFDVAPGDSVRLGARIYEIVGRLEQSPGATAMQSMVSPRVFVPYADLDSTLLGRGSRVEHEVLFRFPGTPDIETLAGRLRVKLDDDEVTVRTPSSVADDWQAGVQNLYRFLGLVGFAALLLGGLGVASAMNVYVKKEIETVAVLRCLGAKSGRAFRVFLAQAAGLGLVAAALGAALGVGVQLVLPHVLGSVLPVSADFSVSWPAVGSGLAVGVGAALLFALLPLLKVRRVSPMRALRSEVENGDSEDAAGRWGRGGVWLLIAAGVAGFSVQLAPDWRLGLGYAGGVIVVFGLLALLAAGVARGAQVLRLPALPYPWRQGLANLHRPGNQTRLLIGVLGFGTFLILTLLLSGRTLREQVRVADRQGRPNVILFGVQSDQVGKVAQTVRNQRLPVLDTVPIVAMQLKSVKGRSIEEIEEAGDDEWAHTHDYRATYRDHLIDSETITAGRFVREKRPYDPDDVVPISVETDIAGDLGVTLGDTLTFDVQGVPVTARVASLRKVDWKRVQTNFFTVFPPGALAEAPTTYVVLSRAPGEAASARLQQAVAKQFPNVLAIDLSLVLEVFDRLFGQLAQVMRFMALFSVLTGLVVLAGAVSASRYRRAEESVLLKTLGGRRRQVFQIMLVEHLLLGLLAALAGLVLAGAASWALARFVFEAALVVAPGALLIVVAAVPILTAGIGLLGSRGLYARPPMDVLRAEA
jgi:putative ABC transport system permease protein